MIWGWDDHWTDNSDGDMQELDLTEENNVCKRVSTAGGDQERDGGASTEE
jgi:hypothetical protein